MKDYKINVEPLEFLLKKYSFNKDKIKRLVIGERYTAVQLNNGNIGVCANLGATIDINSFNKQLDVKQYSHRIILSAYFNALLNYSNNFSHAGDIFDIINFSSYRHAVMIGYFRPIVKKFNKEAINLAIFDFRENEKNIIPETQKKKYLQKADTVILTATSLSNNTFFQIIKSTNNNSDIYLLGPSSLLNNELFNYNLKAIFGTVFPENHDRILEIIKAGKGTREFIKYGNKVCLTNNKKRSKFMKKFAVPTMDGKICAHFGHCQKFAIVKTEDNKVIDIGFVDPPTHTPGAYPKYLASLGVDVIISGGMGRKAQQLFKDNGIEVCVGIIEGTPENLVEKYINDTLPAGSNLCDH